MSELRLPVRRAVSWETRGAFVMTGGKKTVVCPSGFRRNAGGYIKIEASRMFSEIDFSRTFFMATTGGGGLAPSG